MKLPVKQILSKNKKNYQIIDADDKIVVTDAPNLGEALEIEEALNNYKISLDLLYEALDKLCSYNEDITDSIINKIKDFLNNKA